jgi:hypothetical protein
MRAEPSTPITGGGCTSPLLAAFSITEKREDPQSRDLHHEVQMRTSSKVRRARFI